MSFNVCTTACAFGDDEISCGFSTPAACMCGGGAQEDTATKLEAALCN